MTLTGFIRQALIATGLFMALVAQPVTAADTTNNHSLYIFEDEAGGSVEPSSVVRVQDDLYFLGPKRIQTGAATIAI